MEEYPLAERDMQKTKTNEWMLTTNVCSFEGIGRFVMGLYDEIEIIGSPEFETFIRNKIDKIVNLK
jgi:hypothetical protein